MTDDCMQGSGDRLGNGIINCSRPTPIGVSIKSRSLSFTKAYDLPVYQAFSLFQIIGDTNVN